MRTMVSETANKPFWLRAWWTPRESTFWERSAKPTIITRRQSKVCPSPCTIFFCRRRTGRLDERGQATSGAVAPNHLGLRVWRQHLWRAIAADSGGRPVGRRGLSPRPTLVRNGGGAAGCDFFHRHWCYKSCAAFHSGGEIEKLYTCVD